MNIEKAIEVLEDCIPNHDEVFISSSVTLGQLRLILRALEDKKIRYCIQCDTELIDGYLPSFCSSCKEVKIEGNGFVSKEEYDQANHAIIALQKKVDTQKQTIKSLEESLIAHGKIIQKYKIPFNINWLDTGFVSRIEYDTLKTNFENYIMNLENILTKYKGD